MGRYFIPAIIFIAGGICGVFFYAGLLTVNSPSEAVISGPLPEESVLASPSPADLWQTVAREGTRSSVIIQVFQNERLIRTGGGVLVTADGLVVSVSDTIPSGSVYIYQIAYDDKILRGKVVARSLQNNLVLLKTDGADFNIADFEDDSVYQSGQEIIAAAKTLDVSKPVIFAQRGIISQPSGRLFILDTPINSALNGAQTLGISGKGLGLTFIRSGKVWMIPAATITQFIGEYLASVTAD